MKLPHDAVLRHMSLPLGEVTIQDLRDLAMFGFELQIKGSSVEIAYSSESWSLMVANMIASELSPDDMQHWGYDLVERVQGFIHPYTTLKKLIQNVKSKL